jgi:type III restriction enzyme
MKLKFKSQSFQTDAVNAVTSIFNGQNRRADTFTIVNEKQLNTDKGLGVRNVLELSDEQIIENMHEVQKRRSLPLTDDASRHFCVEMDTGTGKTYVYIKTILELHKQYGFTKFIIVVPSVAIREGVYKSFQITAGHFAAQYDNAPVRYFIYDSKKLAQIRLFATSSDIEIMIINIDAFKKAENVINQEQDRLSGETAMKYIQGTNPIVIIDEPQSVDNTPKAKEAISALNPLAVLRYSATHREKVNLLYRLTSVDAYQLGLVKQICVSSNQVESDFNRPYVRLVSVSGDGGFSARIEIDKAAKSGKVGRKTISVNSGADLYVLSGGRGMYKGYKIVGIDCTPEFERIEFADGQSLPLGDAFGDIDENIIKRAQIYRTIEAHFEKELRYADKGIKVLSLFFIDEVSRYRGGAECRDNNAECRDGGGVYARMFEECYQELIWLPKFEKVRRFWHGDISTFCIIDSVSTHGGYFSQDKKGNLKNTKGDTADDYDTYNTIMRDKERLLGFDCPLRFIFSHSALKEGWDNPNVFQVCTLIEQKSSFTARQKVGRGLRLCVNQNGDRIEDRNINILHVMANESFADFAAALQKEIEEETGIKFGILHLGLFDGLTYTASVTEEKTVTDEQARLIANYVTALASRDDAAQEAAAPPIVNEFEYLKPVIQKASVAVEMGVLEVAEKISGLTYLSTREVEQTVSYDDAQELLEHFVGKGYITKSGKVLDSMKTAIAGGALELPTRFEPARRKVEMVIAKANTKPPIHDASKEVRVRLKKQVETSPEFRALWNKIKGRTSYRVTVDEEVLKKLAVDRLSQMERVPKAKVVTTTVQIEVEQSGVTPKDGYERIYEIENGAHRLPDLLRAVDEECFLSRRSIAEILLASNRAEDFLNNPQKMIEVLIEVLRSIQGKMEIDGISYKRLEGREFFYQEIFDAEELIAFLDKNAIQVENSIYDHVIYDSKTIERPFAEALDSDPDVKMFFKIPDKFIIETPIGPYTPDWAVYLDRDGSERLYFVIETKGVSGQIGFDKLSGTEGQKIRCGAEHFKALGSGVEFKPEPVRSWQEFKRAL